MSSPWSAVLESLHSALIDELNERFPEEKPVLGLPVRKQDFSLPAGTEEQVFFEISVGGAKGRFCLAGPGSGVMKVKLFEVAQGVISRARQEFARRGLGGVALQGLADSSSGPRVTRAIWIPLELKGKWYLGVGI